MKPNPGGVLTGEAIVDREKETGLIWNTLQNQSVVLVSERRVGKTSVLRKMDLKINYNYNAGPINNMKIITLDGMQINGAKLLCAKLSEGENYQFDDREKMFEYICLLTDRLPFYIQHIFAYIYELKDKKNIKELIDEAITDILNDSTDKGFFRHYQDRIKTYYYEHIRELALLILDHACKKDQYWEEGDIINLIKTQG